MAAHPFMAAAPSVAVLSERCLRGRCGADVAEITIVISPMRRADGRRYTGGRNRALSMITLKAASRAEVLRCGTRSDSVAGTFFSGQGWSTCGGYWGISVRAGAPSVTGIGE